MNRESKRGIGYVLLIFVYLIVTLGCLYMAYGTQNIQTELQSGFRIRIDLMRIRIQHFFLIVSVFVGHFFTFYLFFEGHFYIPGSWSAIWMRIQIQQFKLMRLRMRIRIRNPGFSTDNCCIYQCCGQCCGSMTFWGGSGSGCFRHWPSQDAKKINLKKVFYAYYFFKDKKSKISHKQ